MKQGRWAQVFCALSVVLASGGVSGCRAGPPRTEGVDTDLVSMLRLPGTGVARGQKETPVQPVSRPINLLNIGPARAGSSDVRASRIRAVVNDQAILDEEVYAAAMQLLGAARTEADKARILNAKLNEIIDRELVIQDAVARLSKRGGKFLAILQKAAAKEFEKRWLHPLMKANKYTSTSAFRKFLKASGVPVEMVQRQWERDFMALEYLKHRIEPSLNKIGHLQIVEYYDRHPDQFQVSDAVVWQDLFIETARHPSQDAARQFAQVLANRIRQGEDFVRLAKQYDNGDSSLRENSEGEGHKRGEISPREAESVLFSLSDGSVGLIELETGFHVIRVVKRTRAGRQPFDEKVQKAIKNKLQNEVFAREMKRIVNNLKRQAIIEVADKLE